MLTLFSQERATELYGMEMREEGIGIGRAEGIGIGRAEGIGIGMQEGIANTYISLVRRNRLTKAEAAADMGISISELEEKLQMCQK